VVSGEDAAIEEFFARLKEHKLVQWTLGYVAVSFALIPVLDIIASRFGWPQTAVRCIIIALATGFFMMLVVAWYHGERGEQRITRTEHAILAVLLVLGALVMWWVGPATEKLFAPTSKAAVAASIPEKSVAVLPLVNESGNKDEQYFSDGLSENLITALSQFAGLKVISRNSSFQFRDTKEDSTAIGRKLGVAHLLEGSVQRAGDVVRVSAELVNADDGSTLWSQRYDRPYKELFALQDDITEAVAAALKAKLLEGGDAVVQSDRPPSGNLDAYAAYLRATSGAGGSVHQAIDELNEAIRLDPHYAAAYAELSMKWTSLHRGGLSGDAAQQAAANAHAAVNTALALDPDLATAHQARCFVLSSIDFDWNGAEAECRRALLLAPGNTYAKAALGNVLGGLGHPEQAIEAMRQVLKGDPRNAGGWHVLGEYLLSSGHLDEAEQATRKQIELGPHGLDNYAQLAIIEVLRGHAPAALAFAQQEPSPSWRRIALALARQIGADPVAADAALKSLIDTDADASPYQIAEVYALRKDPDNMFKWLDHAWAVRDAGITSLLQDPFLRRYQNDPRFAALCRKIGLPMPGAAAQTASGAGHG
jgi:TolB-like protein/Tfp pilus assembly protein PilF